MTYIVDALKRYFERLKWVLGGPIRVVKRRFGPPEWEIAPLHVLEKFNDRIYLNEYQFEMYGHHFIRWGYKEIFDE